MRVASYRRVLRGSDRPPRSLYTGQTLKQGLNYVRMRDGGHAFTGEAFVVPRDGRDLVLVGWDDGHRGPPVSRADAVGAAEMLGWPVPL